MLLNKLSVLLSIAAASVFSSAAAFASADVDVCRFNVRPYTVFFSNGINNSPEKARVSLEEAYKELTASNDISDPASILVARVKPVGLYHANDGFVQDVSETLLQKVRAEGKNQAITWNNIVQLANGVPSPLISLSQLLPALGDFDADQMKQKALAQVDLESKSDVKSLIAYLASHADSRALVIGHSQGTLYANSLYANSIAAQQSGAWPAGGSVDDRVRVVNVGVAADHVGGQPSASVPPQYATSYFDTVILGLRGASATLDLNPPLPANMSAHFVRLARADGIVGMADVILNHGFVSTYLFDTSSAYPLRQLLRNVLLQGVSGYASKPTARIEVQFDVSSPLGNNIFPDSSSIGGASPLGAMHAVTSLPNISMRVAATKGVSTTSLLLQPLSCNYDALHDLRLDSPKRETLGDITNKPLQLTLVHNQTESILAVRYHIVNADGSPSSNWVSVDISGLDTNATVVTIPLFTYNMYLRLGAVHLSIL